ncbi:MAG TPA: ATP-binding cassette domain-containing protein, partial [Acidobacteria bacterium]|nr:ATP-binding cassette domain-containing protein [Acidobacteriota bacterium]
LSLRLPAGTSLERGSATFEQVERELLGTAGVASVSSFIEEGSGSLTIRLEDPEQRPPETTAASLRARVERLVEQDLPGTRVFRPGEDQAGGGGGTEQTAGLLGAGPARVRLSGPDAERLLALGRQLAARLGALEEVDAAWVAGGGNLAELRVEPRRELLTALGLPVESILPALSAFRREGVALPVGMVGQDGKQIPVTVFRQGAKLDRRALERIPLSTPAGSTTLGVISDFRVQRAAPVIRHRNGRREVSVLYRLSSELPEVGPRRVEIERQLRATVRSLALPRGYTLETETRQAATSWFKKVLVPVLLLLFAVLAVTFESFSLPVLVLLALPLTLVGAAWSLIAAGMPADLMALVGTLALLGLTVNPAILLVDRMQQRTRSGVWGPGAAALAAVRERARPVLMTTVTTLAGLWPLALATGQENEIWPPFATVVMGGLAASTVLTLVVIPLAYVLLRRLDMLFGRLGPWVVLIWLGLTTVVVAPLFKGGAVTSLTWQIVTTVLVATGWLLLIALIWRREPPPEPLSEAGAPPRLEVRALTKLYGLPGPLRAALGAEREFLERVRARGARAWLPGDAVEPLARYALLAGGAGYLAYASSGGVWKILFLFVTAGLLGQWLRQVRRWRGKVDDIGRQTPGGLEGALAFALPWVAWEVVLFRDTLSAWFEGRAELGWRLAGTLLLAGVIALTQYARHLARHDPRSSEGEGGRWYGRAALRRLARRWLLPGAPAEVVRALDHAEFDAERGMIGILGPNGAGKTTLLRLLAGILDPVTGVVRLGGQPLEGLRRRLAHWLGYLPQDFGLPGNMTGREYLLYFALLYEITPAGLRRERVDRLLEEVGLGEKADQRIADYSGGMRQRVAIARTLLRLPPVIIVDEPTVGLDPRERIRFRNLLARLARGRIVLFSTHVVEDVEVSCERVLVLSGGRLVYDGSPQGLARRAAGRVWELKLSGDRAPKLPERARVVDETPLGDGSRRLRVLSDVAPGEQASPAEPSLEDGYMLLVRGTA